MNDIYNIIICGVGGQGIVLSSRILGEAGVKLGFSVRIGETFGAAQRGGSVVSHVRIGIKEKVYSPTILKGKCDLLLGFEPVETLRYIDYLSPQGTIIVNTSPVYPISVLAKREKYPSIDEIINTLKTVAENVLYFDATAIANAIREESKMKVTPINMVILGAATAIDTFPIPASVLKESISEAVPQKYIEPNLKAFEEGREKALKILKLGEVQHLVVFKNS